MIGALKRAYRFWNEQWWPGYCREKYRWQEKSSEIREKIEIFYGHDNLPGHNNVVTGGLVKVQDLVEHFPSNPVTADLVYLISSALPRFDPGFAGLLLPSRASLLAKNALKNGRPVILNQNGVAYPAWCPSGWKRVNRTNRDIMRQADYVIYQSEFCRQTAERFLQVKPRAWEILHNPVNTKVLVPLQKKEGAPWQLLVTGSHWEFYRIESAVKTLGKLIGNNYDVELNVAGMFRWGQNDKESKRRIVDLARGLGIEGKVRFLGPYTQSDVVALFGKVHILLHTKYNDPCPRSVVESMSCGVPVVYSASGGVPELVESRGGLGVPAPVDWERNHPPSSGDLARAVEQIVADYQLYSAGARACAVERLDVSSWLTRHEKIFREILREN